MLMWTLKMEKLLQVCGWLTVGLVGYCLYTMEPWKLCIVACAGVVLTPIVLNHSSEEQTNDKLLVVENTEEKEANQQATLPTTSKDVVMFPSSTEKQLVCQRGIVMKTNGSYGNIMPLQDDDKESRQVHFQLMDSSSSFLVGDEVNFYYTYQPTSASKMLSHSSSCDDTAININSTRLRTNSCNNSALQLATIVAERVELISRPSVVTVGESLLSNLTKQKHNFALAMDGITCLSPRSNPVMEHLDLIKYAQELDESEDEED